MDRTSNDKSGDRELGPEEVYCRHCGALISEKAEICPECGVRQFPSPRSSADKTLDNVLEGGNPFVAAVLSAIFPGLGQIYNRELEKGIVIIVAGFVSVFLGIVFIGFLLLPLVWLYAIYDAYTVADRQRSAVEQAAGAASHGRDQLSSVTERGGGPTERTATEDNSTDETDTELGDGE